MRILRSLVFALVVLLSTNVFSKTFTSQFSEFELPNGWDCILEGSEWVCQSDNKERKKEAIIILAAKYRGEQDSLDQYQAYLKTPKTFNLPGGKTQVSEAKAVAIKEINGQRWVDSLHLASEVPGFYTRYLATVKDSLGIAITFSVAKDHFDSYQEIFEKIIATLRVFDQKKNSVQVTGIKSSEGDLIGDGVYIPDSSQNADIGVQKKSKGGPGGEDTTTIIGIVVVAAIAFILMKAKKKKKK